MTGLYLLPGALMGLLGGPLAGRLGGHFGWRVPLVVGMAVTGLGIASFALWHDDPWQIVVGNIALGFGIVAGVRVHGEHHRHARSAPPRRAWPPA